MITKKVKYTICKSKKESIVFKSEVRLELDKMKRNKAAGTDKILIVLNDLMIDNITKVINEIYDSNEVAYTYKINLHHYDKKVDANKCKLHWTISLVSHLTKLSIKILLKHQKIRQNIQKQCGFFSTHWNKKSNLNTHNAIKVCNTNTKRSISMFHRLHKGTKIQDEELLEIVGKLNLPRKIFNL